MFVSNDFELSSAKDFALYMFTGLSPTRWVEGAFFVRF